MLLTYLGHSAFLFETKGKFGLIDPFIKGNPNCKMTLESLPKIDYILVTHGHCDHLGDTVEIARKYSSKVICNYEISLYLSKYNLDCHAMHIGGAFNFEFGRVKMVPALHGSSILEGNHIICGGTACGFILELDSKKIYHAGDTGLTVEMQLLEEENIDVALLPIGGNFTMDMLDAVRAVEMFKPKMLIPMHYSTFELIDQDPQKLQKMIKDRELDCKVQIFKPGYILKHGEE